MVIKPKVGSNPKRNEQRHKLHDNRDSQFAPEPFNLLASHFRARADFSKHKTVIRDNRHNNGIEIIHRQNSKRIFRESRIVHKCPNGIAYEIDNMPKYQSLKKLILDLRRREPLDTVQKEQQYHNTPDVYFGIKSKNAHNYQNTLFLLH